MIAVDDAANGRSGTVVTGTVTIPGATVVDTSPSTLTLTFADASLGTCFQERLVQGPLLLSHERTSP